MCFSAAMAALSVVGTVKGAVDANKARKDAKAQAAAAKAEQQAAETTAAQNAANKTAMQRKALRDNSLFTGGGNAGAGYAGRTTLGV